MSWPALCSKSTSRKVNLKFGTLTGNKWANYFTEFLGTFFHRVYEQLIFRVKRCNFLLHTGSWIRTSFLPSRNYTAIIERKIACTNESQTSLVNNILVSGSLKISITWANWTETEVSCDVCGGSKTLMSNITAPWWSKLPQGWKEVFCNTEETKLKFSCVTLKNKISACKVALWIACEQALHLGESRFTRHKWRAR